MSLSVRDVNFSYGRKDILRDISFDISSGTLTAVLGENGSGKTTLLRVLNRLLGHHGGTVLVDGKDTAKMGRRDMAKYMAYMPQRQTAVYCTVFETVLMGMKARGGGFAEDDTEEIERILHVLHLEYLAMRPTTELSGGELQKVILARALAQQPKVLLLDEPINHLDPVNQIEVMSLLHGITRDFDIASLVVTHDLNSAVRFADRFIFLKEGRIIACGGVEVVTKEAIKEAFRIDVTLKDVDGITVIVPHLTGVRPHVHGRDEEHSHEVFDHVYDHEHDTRVSEESRESI